MWDVFSSMFDTVWMTIDDVLVSVALLLITFSITERLYVFLKSYLNVNMFVSQGINFAITLMVVLLVIQHLFGMQTYASLIGGVSIGIGYALQPYIIGLFNGMMMQSREPFSVGSEIEFEQVKGTVQEIGLFYTYICTDKDKKVVIPNQMFHQGFVTVHNESCLRVQNDVYSLHTLSKT